MLASILGLLCRESFGARQALGCAPALELRRTTTEMSRCSPVPKNRGPAGWLQLPSTSKVETGVSDLALSGWLRTQSFEVIVHIFPSSLYQNQKLKPHYEKSDTKQSGHEARRAFEAVMEPLPAMLEPVAACLLPVQAPPL